MDPVHMCVYLKGEGLFPKKQPNMIQSLVKSKGIFQLQYLLHKDFIYTILYITWSSEF